MSSTAVVDDAAPPRQTAAADGPRHGAPVGRAGDANRRPRPWPALPGQLFVLVTVVPALLATAWLIAAFPLAALGWFRPVAVVPLAVLVAVAVVPLGVALAWRSGRAMRAPWWSLIATVTVAVYFARYAASTHDEQIILRRDAGSYAQIGYWLAHHPGLTYRVPTGAFGPNAGELVYGSPAFYHVGDVLIPQFMTGWPTALAAAYWAGGWHHLFELPALVGGCAILAIGGLAARLVGARWAPLAALATALAWPVLRVTQATFSEPLALLLLAAELCLLVDVVAAAPARSASAQSAPGTAASGSAASATGRVHRLIRCQAFAAGLVLGAGELVRLDFGVDAALIIPVVAWLYVTRRPGATAYVAGALVTGCLAVADGALVTRPYLHTNATSVRLMTALMVVVAVAAAGTVLFARRREPVLAALFGWRWLPVLGAAGVVAVAAALVIRPYVWTDHSVSDPNTAEVTANLQIAQGLPADGSRGYAEQSLWWVGWYLGAPLLIAALAGATVLTWRVLRGRDAIWLAPLLVYAGSSVQTLLRPGVAPDHPWADRRLVVEVLPGMVLFAVWALAALTRLTRALIERAATDHGGRAAAAGWRRGVGAGLAAVLALGLSAVALRPVDAVTAPLAPLRTELGEVVASQLVCEALRPTDSVVLIGSLWVPTVRSQCGLPVAQVIDPSPAKIDRLAASIRAAGRTPVFAAEAVNPLEDLGLKPARAVVLMTSQDQNVLVTRPFSTQLMRIEFWLVRR